MRDRPAALATVAGVTGASAIGLLLATATTTTPLWPVFPMTLVFIVSMALLFFGPSTPAALDRHVKRGNKLRDRIVRESLDEQAADELYDHWFKRAHKIVHRHRPTYENRLMLAEPPADYTGQLRVIGSLNATTRVLQEARDHLP